MRQSANTWRHKRDRELLSELLKLRWSSIDFDCRWLTVEGGNAKTRRTRYVPLNDEAMSVLTRWREQASEGPRVFEISTSFKTAWGRLLKHAQITNFRWHDLRHHFASRPVQHDVPLKHGQGSAWPQPGGHFTALCAPGA